MRSAVRAPYFVPETIKADALFRNMKRTGSPLAVVLDEYGGMVGIVTLNDLVEELVGDLGDDDSGPGQRDEPCIEKREDGSLLLTGNVELDDIEDALNIQLDQEEHDTLYRPGVRRAGRYPRRRGAGHRPGDRGDAYPRHLHP